MIAARIRKEMNIKAYLIPLAVAVAIIGTAGCSRTPADIQAQPGQEVSLSAGQTAVIDGEDLRIKFVEVVSDSRCPNGVTCIWQGEVSALVEISLADSVHQLVLTQPGLTAEPAAKIFGGYELVFYMDPYPEAGKSISKSDYRLHITINKAFPLEGGILATFDVVGETYRIFVTNETTIEQVFALQRGESQATIPSGLIVRGSVPYNEPWSWHIDPGDIHMAEFTIELCDGTPSQVEANLDYWVETVKRFCPWGAELVGIQDYR